LEERLRCPRLLNLANSAVIEPTNLLLDRFRCYNNVMDPKGCKLQRLVNVPTSNQETFFVFVFFALVLATLFVSFSQINNTPLLGVPLATVCDNLCFVCSANPLYFLDLMMIKDCLRIPMVCSRTGTRTPWILAAGMSPIRKKPCQWQRSSQPESFQPALPEHMLTVRLSSQGSVS
jgi:hypothetical protein